MACRFRIVAIAILASVNLGAQTWLLRDHGVGLLENTRADPARPLRVLQAGQYWSLAGLTRQGVLANTAPRTFEAWIQGPVPRAFMNSRGVPVFMYKVRITDPRGQTRTFGPLDFPGNGQATQALEVQEGPPGSWKVEWFTVRTTSLAEALVAVDRFQLNP